MVLAVQVKVVVSYTIDNVLAQLKDKPQGVICTFVRTHRHRHTCTHTHMHTHTHTYTHACTHNYTQTYPEL